MRVYVLTEEQRNALLQELELEKFKKSQFVTEHTTEEQLLEIVHRKFHCIVCRALEA
jgi:hypothetical protein